MIYFDHNATTIVDARVLKEMLPFFRENFANPSSLYRSAVEAREAINNARVAVAESLGCLPKEVYFTSGGTESNNLAIKGVAWRGKGDHIITSMIEHSAVMNPCRWLEKRGFAVSYIPVSPSGIVEIESLKKAIRKETVLISVMWVNNEIGTLQPVKEIGEIAREKGIYFHTDAVQAVGKVTIDLKEVKVDMLTLSGHKIYGPKGIGALIIRKGLCLESLIHGGSHEMGLRAGTENLPGIVGLGYAIKIGIKDLIPENKRVLGLRRRLEQGLLNKLDGITINGGSGERVSNTVSFCIDGVEGESVLLHLDMNGICVSSGSACSSGKDEPSHVLLAMGIKPRMASGALRVSLGRENTEEEVDRFLEILSDVVAKLRSLSPNRI